MHRDDRANMSNVVLVLGMHRSGTSAVSGTLIKLGCGEPKLRCPQTLVTLGATSNRTRLCISMTNCWPRPDRVGATGDLSIRDWYRSPTATAFRRRARDTFAEEFTVCRSRFSRTRECVALRRFGWTFCAKWMRRPISSCRSIASGCRRIARTLVRIFDHGRNAALVTLRSRS